jgi:hypothetical protein
VIDIKLGDRDSLEVCQALFHHRVPFLFHTGHTDAELVKAWPEIPLLVKLAWPHEVVACVADLVNLSTELPLCFCGNRPGVRHQINFVGGIGARGRRNGCEKQDPS